MRAERDTADELIDTELSHKRVGQAVPESREEAGERIQEVRDEADARRGKHSGHFPEVSEKLEPVADSLSKAAASLTGVAESLNEAKAEQPEPVDLVTNMAQVAQQVKDTPGGITETSQHPKQPEDSGNLTTQLAEIAEGMAEVTAALAEERRDVNEHLAHQPTRAFFDGYSGLVFSAASFSLMNARISSDIASSFVHCSLYSVTGKRPRP